jgi:glycosyltransferase involved in cell wall biosynthesis
VAVARNVALASSDSELVVVFDDDDVWMPTRLATQVSALEREPDAVACHTQFEIIDDQGRVTHPGDASPVTLEQLLDGSRHPFATTSMFRREFVDLVGWYHGSLRAMEDFDLLCRLAASGPLIFIDEVLISIGAIARIRRMTTSCSRRVPSRFSGFSAWPHAQPRIAN